MSETQTSGTGDLSPFGDPAEFAEAFDRNTASWRAAGQPVGSERDDEASGAARINAPLKAARLPDGSQMQGRKGH